jgi:hypothetical protein
MHRIGNDINDIGLTQMEAAFAEAKRRRTILYEATAVSVTLVCLLAVLFVLCLAYTRRHAVQLTRINRTFGDMTLDDIERQKRSCGYIA